MKLYLSSFRLGETPEQLAELAGGKGPVAFIANALDYFSDLDKKAAVIARGIEDFKAIGLESHLIDLRQYFGSSEKFALKELSQEISCTESHQESDTQATRQVARRYPVVSSVGNGSNALPCGPAGCRQLWKPRS